MLKNNSNSLFNKKDLDLLFLNYKNDKSDVNFRLLYKHTKRQTYNAVYTIIKDFELTNDIVTECYMLLVRKIDQIENTNGHYNAWFYSMVRNLTYDYCLNKVGFVSKQDLYRKMDKVSLNTRTSQVNTPNSNYNNEEFLENLCHNEVVSIWGDVITDTNDISLCGEIDDLTFMDIIKKDLFYEWFSEISDIDRNLLVEKYIHQRKVKDIIKDEIFCGYFTSEGMIRTRIFNLKKLFKNFFEEKSSILYEEV
jgi:hypothetical protein